MYNVEENRQRLTSLAKDVMEHPVDYYVPPFKMLERVYCIPGKFVNQYLVDTGDGGLALIDAGYESAAYLLIDSVHRLGFDPKDIRHIFLTHGHFDHVGAAAKLKAFTNAKVYCCPGDMYFFEPGNEHLALWPTEPFEVDELYDYETVYEIGDCRFLALHSPGHTPGTSSVLYEVPHHGERLVCGIQGGFGLNGLSKKELRESGFGEDMQLKFYNTLTTQQDLHVDCYTPAHHASYNLFERRDKDDGTGRAFIDSGAWKKFHTVAINNFIEAFGSECGLKGAGNE